MINLDWCGDYIDISDQDPNLLALKITTAGMNIETVHTNKNENLVIGEVRECLPHPNSDHLHVCQVDVGKCVLQIVCGAPNIRKGLKVIVALPGCKLPDGEIKKSVIRGIESNGMICALFELGLEEKSEENYNRGIEELDENAPIGQNALEYLGCLATTYELDIHKHRNNDCYYHIGFAYEIASILNRKVTLPLDNFKEIKDDIKNYINIEVETSKCSYYSGRIVKNVIVKESPDFIKKRLQSVGIRSINNVVDISNYVMLKYGQPLHFFDLDKLGNKVVVRQAKFNEKIVTLDEKERNLSEDDIVITDGNKPVCLAGVMGGVNTEVELDTKNIFIEAAIFDSIAIRNTASRHNLKSEASIRYGKGLSEEYTALALKRACYLLEKYASGEVLTGDIVYDTIDKTEKKIQFKASDVCSLLGLSISTKDMEEELKRLGFTYQLKDDLFDVLVPKRRLDIEANVNDIAEEIGRLYGYEQLESTLPNVKTRRGIYVGDVKIRKEVSKRLRTLGLNEIKTYTLVSREMSDLFDYEKKEKVILPNPMSSDKSIIRTTLLPSILNTYYYNKTRKNENINLYEIAKTYDKNYTEDVKVGILMSGNYLDSNWSKKVKVDFYLLKGIVENLLNYLGFMNRYTFSQVDNLADIHPGIGAKILLDNQEIGIIGKVHPSILKDDVYVCELSITKLNIKTGKIKYKEACKYPFINKDVAFIVDKNISAFNIIQAIRKSGGKYLVDIKIFDVYEGENLEANKKSIAFTLTYQSSEKTLTDDEVMIAFEKTIMEVTNKLHCEIRDK